MRGLATFARDHLGLQLHRGQRGVLEGWSASGKRKALLRLGRRSGKGVMAASAAIMNATVGDYSEFLRPGEQRFILVVATRQAQAAEFIRVTKELLAAAPDPDLAALVDTGASTVDEIVFRCGVTIRALPCSSRSARGLAASMVVLDEGAHFQTEGEGFAAFRSVWRALVPSVAQFGERGYVLVTSTPLWPSGPFFDLYNSGELGVDPELFVVARPTWEVVDTPGVRGHITRASLDGEFLSDPEGAAVEYGAEWGQGAGAYLNAIAVHECVVRGRRSLAPVPGVTYVGCADPAFAAGGDAFTFAVGHRVGEGEDASVVVDVVRAWRGRQSPLDSDAVLDEIADLARAYGLREVTSDQHAFVPLENGLRRRGVGLRLPRNRKGEHRPLDNELKADVFSALRTSVNLRHLELPDDPALLSELVHLESRPPPAGIANAKPRIMGASGHHDDRAMVVALVVYRLLGRRRNAIEYVREELASVTRPRLEEREVRPVKVPAGGHEDRPPAALKEPEPEECRHPSVSGGVCLGCGHPAEPLPVLGAVR